MKSIAFSAKPLSFLLKILLPIFLGLGVTVFLYYREFNHEQIILSSFSSVEGLSAFLAVLFLLLKDFSLSLRFRILCRPASLSWKGAIRTNYLCEFTSAATPSAIGGSAFIMAYLYREGITVGRSTAVMISTLFLDELLFVIICPFCLLLFPSNVLFGMSAGLSSGLRCTFLIVYLLIAVYTGLLYFALFIKPEFVRKIFTVLFRLPFLRRYELSASHFTQDLEVSSHEMKNQSFLFWIKVFVLTLLAWISRYAVACALFAPYIAIDKQPLVLCRQFVLWIVMMITPTPGGSGVSEYLFTQYYSDLPVAAADTLFITCIWRILTYYVYLFVGICILPSWMKKTKRIIKNK